MEANDTQNEENPRKTLTGAPLPSDPRLIGGRNSNGTLSALQRPPSSTGAGTSRKDGGDEPKATTVDPTAVISDSSGSVSDTQKKIRRAERFGMPVQLSEKEKRNSRAERFGIGSGLRSSDAIKKLEENKMKSRAERFGLLQSVPSDEEARKKTRLARFAPVAKTDPLEEEKNKARALRSSQTSSSLTQAHGKGNIELKPAIAGKAGGEA